MVCDDEREILSPLIEKEQHHFEDNDHVQNDIISQVLLNGTIFMKNGIQD
jgi:hypothetical protein